ncbi:MAG: protein-tyrosine phosphatase family protein [Planctomycetota bacterium]|jgi:hypothetical protein
MAPHGGFREDMRDGVYRITQATAVGPYPRGHKGEALHKRGITHILNVGSNRNRLAEFEDHGFRALVARPIEDLWPMELEWITGTLDVMHGMLREPDSKLYVHCIAGQNRGPTTLWLYLIACGMRPEAATELIGDNAMDSVPGHPSLVDDERIALAIEHGKAHFRGPHLRAEILTPFEL